MGTVEATLTDVAVMLLDKFFTIIPLNMLAWSSRSAEERERDSSQGVRRAQQGTRMIADYIGAEAKLGRLRSDDREVVAHTLIGALWHYAYTHVTGGGSLGARPARLRARRGAHPLVRHRPVAIAAQATSRALRNPPRSLDKATPPN